MMKRFRKLLAAVVALALILQIAGVPAVAVEVGEAIDGIATLASGDVIASGYCGDEGDGKNLSWKLTDDGALTISGNGEMADSPQLGNNSKIKSVNICQGVTSIGDSAFYKYTGLTEVTIPNSVTSIGDNAFRGCKSLHEVKIPDGVLEIKEHTFSECSSLTSVTIPNSVTNIGYGAFSSCVKLSSIKIPNSVTVIDDTAFAGCKGLTSLTIPNSVTIIGNSAFYDCTSLTSVTIPDSVTFIGERVFWECTSLTSVTIPNSVTSIGYGSFSGCTSLHSIIIPKGVTSIYGYAFDGCDSMTDIYCEAESKPDGWGSKWSEWNEGCNATIHWGYKDGSSENIIASGYCGGEGDGTNLSWILTEDGTLTISGSGNMANWWFWMYVPWYGNIDSIRSVVINNGVTNIGEYAFYGCTSLTSVTIPDSVTSIGRSAFSRCLVLTSVNIPNSVASIGSFAFASCANLTEFEVASENVFYCSDNGILFAKDKSELICYPAGKKESSYVIPDSVTYIGDAAFLSCISLTSVTIPNSVTSIGKNAFLCCYGLTGIEVSSESLNV